MSKRFQDLSGQRFGFLTAKKHILSKNGVTIWLMVCDCGENLELSTSRFKRKQRPQQSCMKCGAKRRSIHGMTNTKEFFAWRGILSRCNNSNDAAYKDYGARGITVCKRWLEFKNFFEDMGYAPTKKHSIDRVENDKGYYKENCRWATDKQQCRNHRKNKIIEYNNEKKCLAEWAELLNYPYRVLFSRLKLGWSIEKSFTEPYIKRK